MKRVAKWLAIIIGGLIGLVVVLAIIGSIVGKDKSDNQSAQTSTVIPTPTPWPKDVILFGTGNVEKSKDLALTGVSKEFAQGEEIWLRMGLSKAFGKTEVQYFV